MNTSDEYDIDTIIVRYLDGDATTSEQNVLDTWISQSESNRKQFEDIERIWKITPGAQDAEKIDTQARWDQFVQKTGIDKQSPVATIQSETSDSSLWYKIAAVVIVALGVGVFWLLNSNQETVYIAEETKEIELPDGTRIWLKQGSSLSFVDDNFDTDKREVYLEGEAYFEVVHNTQKPFVVTANNSEIQVLGTTFTVREDTLRRTTSVALLTGKVAFKTDIENEILEPGEISTASYTGEISKTEIEDPNLLAWKTKVLHFEATPLKQVVVDLNRTYAQKIELGNKTLEECTLTINFENESLDKVIQTLQILFDVEVERQNSSIRLTGGSCRK